MRLSGCRCFHIANIELATPKEREYIFLLAQSTPQDCVLILEFGGLAPAIEEDDFRRMLGSYSTSSDAKIIQVKPFDEPVAKEFYRIMSVGRVLPNFDFAQSRGIPICILNEIRIIDSKYSVSGHIKALLAQSGQKHLALILCILGSITERRTIIESVLQDLVPKFDFSPLAEAGVIQIERDFVRYAHASYISYIETTFRAEILDLVSPVSDSLERVDRFGSHVIRLSRGLDGKSGDYVDAEILRWPHDRSGADI